VAISYIKDQKPEVKVILSCDDAITTGVDGYKKYLEDLDEGHLGLAKDPTRFVMRTQLKYDLSEKVKKSQMFYKDGDLQFNAAYYMEEVRARLCGIENPPGVENTIDFKRDGDGGAHKEIVEIIDTLGETLNLFTAIQVAIKSKNELLKKK